MTASNVVIGYANNFKTGSITSSASAAGLGPTNLAGDICSPSTGFQSAATAVQNVILTCTAITPGSLWRAFGLFRTNLTFGAQITITLFSGVSIVFNATVSGPQTGYGQIVVALSSDTAGDSVSFQINDPTNPEGHINIGGAFAGPCWNPASGITWDTTYGRTSQQVKTISRGGQEYRNELYSQRWWGIAMDAVQSSEAWDDLGELERVASFGSNVLFIPDVTSVDISREAVFGILEPQSNGVNFTSHSLNNRGWRAQITERL